MLGGRSRRAYWQRMLGGRSRKHPMEMTFELMSEGW